MNQIDLSGQTAVVTGGAQGIGFAIARRLIASDAKVRISIPRTEFNELAKDGSLRHWRECFESGHVKASGPPEILKLIQSVVAKQEERTRTRKLRTR